MTDPLAPAPANLAAPGGALLTGLWRGTVHDDPVRAVRQRGGRVRRWSYAAAGDEHARLGAAVVDVGAGASAFVWAIAGQRVWTWERTVVGGRGITVPDRPGATGSTTIGGATIVIGPRGRIQVDVPVDGERLVAALRTPPSGSTPAVCATRTPRGGWNVTRKHAGYPVTGRIGFGRETWDLDGGGWSDWTAGRQDRRTSWRWAAGAGSAIDGCRVGLNLSTGMNGDVGENVVWWDGVPHALALTRLEPIDRTEGDWRLAGDGWELRFEAAGVRAADDNLVLLRSRYVQPIGRFTGTLPGPDGAPVDTTLHGVTEDHHARW